MKRQKLIDIAEELYQVANAGRAGLAFFPTLAAWLAPRPEPDRVASRKSWLALAKHFRDEIRRAERRKQCTLS